MKASALLAATICVAVCARSAFADPAESGLKWRSIGPAVAGGRVPAVAGTASDANLYYIGTAGGGVWKTVNGGATWTPVFDKQDVSAIGAVTIDPTNENVVWVGTGESNPRNDVSYGDGVYKSSDGGKSWTNMGLRGVWSFSRILIDPRNPSHVIAGAFGDPFKDSADRGVYVSDDGGRTWTKTLYIGPQSGASDLAMDAHDPAILYAGMWQFRRLPWTFHSGGPQDGLYRSADGGRTWTRLTGHGLPTGETGRIAIAVAPSDSKRVYAIIEAKGGILWRSDDGGTNWTLVSNDTLVDQRPFYFTHVAIDPSNENHLYGISNELAQSTDGGRHFAAIAPGVHVDYHAMWIAPNDRNRMIVGEDGGYAVTLDGGKTWSFSRNLAIGQVYHVGLSLHENPYWACAPLQDNNAFCAPTNSRNREGILDDDWRSVAGGDGMWAVPDPSNSRFILSDSQQGDIGIYDKRVQSVRYVQPYFDFSRNDFALYNRKYRFNWDSPIAFAPWNPHLLWLGGNVVFASQDRGVHWRPISPDLTRNIKAHQQPAGGPLAIDVSSAEYSDNILYIEGSSLHAGEIWVGTDDGLVQMTRDEGRRWRNVTPRGAPEFARVETVAPSPLASGTAYAIFDNHRLGDYAPYLYVTRDYGATWTKITSGLPPNQYVRTVRPDRRNANLVFAGTENGVWISYDGGAHWADFRSNLPPVSVRDIREQPQFNDLAIATHGRDLWILDDISAVQDLPQARASGAMLFKPRTAYEYITHANDEGLYTRFSGQNPPAGAVIDFYQAQAPAFGPSIEILDVSGRVIRHMHPTRKGAAQAPEAEFFGPTAGPGVPNERGINRAIWDLREDGPPQWTGAARAQFRGPQVGALVAPGRYVARIRLDGKTFEQRFTVAKDPLNPYSQAELVAAHDFAKKYFDVEGTINTVLNHLDSQRASLQRALGKAAANAALASRIRAAQADRAAIFDAFTANYQNGEDSLQRPGKLREDIPRAGFGSAQNPPTAALLEYARRYDIEYRAALDRYNSFVRGTLTPLSDSLKAAGLGGIDGMVTVQ